MGHFINHELLESYEDDLITHRVQGVYQGTMTAPQEIALDKKLLQERLARQQLQQRKECLARELDELLTKIAVGTRRRIKPETLDKHRKYALAIRIEMEELKNIKI